MKYTAKYVLIENRFEENACFEVQNGSFQHTEVHFLPTSLGPNVHELGNVAIIPGVINSHSHAFQRIIRGRTEDIHHIHIEDNFWTWREAMYRAANLLDADAVSKVAEFTFLEMARSGITTVGEFHYLHHQKDGTPFSEPEYLANLVIEAARKVGIRITLLNVAYRFGDINIAPKDSQRRFVFLDVSHYMETTLNLKKAWEFDPQVNVGFAPHSVRAVDETWLSTIGKEAKKHKMPLHIHASEQQTEVQNSLKKRGKTPIQWIADNGALGDLTTIVHGNHATNEEMVLMAESGTTLCVCPTTERNLGDGFLPITQALRQGIPITLGSDSHTQIDLFDDLRLLEYHERLRFEKRNVLAEIVAKRSTSEVLLPLLSKHGSRSLGLGATEIAPGEPADFIAIDLDHFSMIGADHNSVSDFITLSMSADAVRDVYVGGKKVIEKGHHLREKEIIENFRTISKELWRKK